MNPYEKPKSVCSCGHTGDGPNSEHNDNIGSPGHGSCKVEDCPCGKFTWVEFTDDYEQTLK